MIIATWNINGMQARLGFLRHWLQARTPDLVLLQELKLSADRFPHAELEETALEWAGRINSKSPMSQRMLKFAFNLIDDGLVGQQVFAGEATRLGYMTEEAQEGRDAFVEKRPQDFGRFPWHY